MLEALDPQPRARKTTPLARIATTPVTQRLVQPPTAAQTTKDADAYGLSRVRRLRNAATENLGASGPMSAGEIAHELTNIGDVINTLISAEHVPVAARDLLLQSTGIFSNYLAACGPLARETNPPSQIANMPPTKRRILPANVAHAT